MHALFYRVICQRGNANEPVSAQKRKRALEFGAYSSDYCALQQCGLVIVQLIYGAAPLRSAFSLSNSHCSLAWLPPCERAGMQQSYPAAVVSGECHIRLSSHAK